MSNKSIVDILLDDMIFDALAGDGPLSHSDFINAVERKRAALNKQAEHAHDNWECEQCQKLASHWYGQGYESGIKVPTKHRHTKSCSECVDFYFNN